MLENLNIAAAGMVAQQQRIAAVANDLANVDTTGYKHTRTGFRDLVYTEAGRAQAGDVQRAAPAWPPTDAGRSFQQGALQRTGQPLDVAIQGDGFLQVAPPDGRTASPATARCSSTPTGQLVTASGALVQPPITVPDRHRPRRRLDRRRRHDHRRRQARSAASTSSPSAPRRRCTRPATTPSSRPPPPAPRRARPPAPSLIAGRARGLERRHRGRDGRHDRRPARLPAGLQGDQTQTR